MICLAQNYTNEHKVMNVPHWFKVNTVDFTSGQALAIHYKLLILKDGSKINYLYVTKKSSLSCFLVINIHPLLEHSFSNFLRPSGNLFNIYLSSGETLHLFHNFLVLWKIFWHSLWRCPIACRLGKPF